jgi:glycosyltransferase involved in cell wall biosynthesis
LGRPLKVGLYSPFFGSTYGGGEKYLGVTAETLRDALPSATIELLSPTPPDIERYERQLDLDLRGIASRSTMGSPGGLSRRLARVAGLRRYRDLVVSARSVGQTADYDLFFSMVYVIPGFTRARRSVILCQFPYEIAPAPGRGGVVGSLKRLHAWPERVLRPRLVGRGMEDFQLIVCQSEYVRQWVASRWGRECEVVNPPIDVPDEEPDWVRKERIVLGVGRFFARGHSKRQDLMVRAFRELCDAGLSGWELHLVGGLQRDHAEDVAYHDRVATLARGYPVTMHVDAPGQALAALYRRAAVYWHAAGFGVDASTRPEDLEHFGMTTVEAMGYGAVPVAIGRGGQVEVVESGVSGYLWTEVEQLKARTVELAADPELRRRLGVAARARSQWFARPAFKQRMLRAVTPLLAELGVGETPVGPPLTSPGAV